MSIIIYHNQNLTSNQEKWKSHYETLIFRSKNRNLEGYCEKHHIIPRCMGGSNHKSNIVKLTAREHFIAHQLLVKIYPDNINLLYACRMMCISPTGKRLNNKEYDWLKTKRSIMMKSENKSNSERVRKIAESMTGKYKGESIETSERVRKSADTQRGRSKNNHNGVHKMSESKNILTIEQRLSVVSMKDNGSSFKQIQNHFIENGITIGYSSLYGIYKRNRTSSEVLF